jgi:hypothetical protein
VYQKPATDAKILALGGAIVLDFIGWDDEAERYLDLSCAVLGLTLLPRASCYAGWRTLSPKYPDGCSPTAPSFMISASHNSTENHPYARSSVSAPLSTDPASRDG